VIIRRHGNAEGVVKLIRVRALVAELKLEDALWREDLDAMILCVGNNDVAWDKKKRNAEIRV